MSSPAFLTPLLPHPPALRARRARSAPQAATPHHATRRTALRLFSLAALPLFRALPVSSAPFSSLATQSAAAPLTDAQPFIPLPCPPSAPACRPVQILDYRVGGGARAAPGSTLYLKWTARLADRFGWPVQREDADEIVVRLGADHLVRGFEMGVSGMRAGGKRRIFVPAEWGYAGGGGPLPKEFGDRRRLFATVGNERRKGGGDVVFDVVLRKVVGPAGAEEDAGVEGG